MNGIVGKVLANPHTTGAGTAIIGIKAGEQIALLWTGAHFEHAIRGTSEALQALALGYGFVMAGDANKSGRDLEAVKKDVAVAIETGNTAMLLKKDLPVVPEPPKTAA